MCLWYKGWTKQFRLDPQQLLAVASHFNVLPQTSKTGSTILFCYMRSVPMALQTSSAWLQNVLVPELWEQDVLDLDAGGWGITLRRSTLQFICFKYLITILLANCSSWMYEELARATDVYLNTYFPCHNYGSYPSWTIRSHITSCFAFQTPYLIRFQFAREEVQLL